ncbi:PaaI family thioesterase [Henriciella sp. AS95]|uniref:PaaI family thioesterase n=1 Tax=Henriciella sp. AS95 TaxID=3135782 RepID=UPI00317136C0
MSSAEDPQDKMLKVMQEHASRIMDAVPWAQALGLKLTKLEKGRAFAKVDWREDLVGDPDTGVIHGGVLTALLDNLSGVCITTALAKPMSMATLDLRIDYMRPAEKGRQILAEAECYHVTRSVAFTRAWAYHESRDKVIATAAATFALNDISRWASGNTALNMANEMLGDEI